MMISKKIAAPKISQKINRDYFFLIVYAIHFHRRIVSTHIWAYLRDCNFYLMKVKVNDYQGHFQINSPCSYMIYHPHPVVSCPPSVSEYKLLISSCTFIILAWLIIHSLSSVHSPGTPWSSNSLVLPVLWSSSSVVMVLIVSTWNINI